MPLAIIQETKPEFNNSIQLNQSGITGIQNKIIKVNGGITTFLGPNGSGKTQLLRGLKNSLVKSKINNALLL